MKVCYFIQSHTAPEQVCRLARVIRQSSPNSQVLISHDFSTSPLDITSLDGLSAVNLIRREQPTVRGDYSLFQVYLDAINWLFEHQASFDWLVYLSGQDYPTQPLSKLEYLLENTDYDGFLKHWKAGPWHPGKKGFNRYYYQYYFNLPQKSHELAKKFSRLNQLQSLVHIYTGCRKLIGVRAFSNPFSEKFICYGNLVWSMLSRSCVQYLRSFLQDNPALVAYYQKTVMPEESILASVLANSKLFNLCDDDKRYAISTSGGALAGYYQTLTVQDYPAIANGDFYFARKFDLKQGSEMLDLLDTKILKD